MDNHLLKIINAYHKKCGNNIMDGHTDTRTDDIKIVPQNCLTVVEA